MTYAEKLAKYETDIAEYNDRRDSAMNEVGAKIGDRVEYHSVPSALFGKPEHFTGTIYLTRRGQPKVRVDQGGTKNWHKGWKAA